MSAVAVKHEGGCFCRCGGVLSFRIRGVGAASIGRQLEGFFWEAHAGDGHGPATMQQAAVARRRQDLAHR